MACRIAGESLPELCSGGRELTPSMPRTAIWRLNHLCWPSASTWRHECCRPRYECFLVLAARCQHEYVEYEEN